MRLQSLFRMTMRKNPLFPLQTVWDTVQRKTDKPTKMKDIVMTVARPFLGRYHHLYTDKLYTSVAAARALLNQSTYLTGAVKSNSRELPVELQRIVRLSKQCPQYHVAHFIVARMGQLTAVIWKDSKVVQLLSSGHQGYRQKDRDFLMRKSKDDGMTRRQQKQVTAPPHAISYTKNMAGVDRADQLRSYYSCSRKSQIWWRKLFYFLMDI